MHIDEIDEGQMVGRELVISGRDTPRLLDLVEPFDQLARAEQSCCLSCHKDRSRSRSALAARYLRASTKTADHVARRPIGKTVQHHIDISWIGLDWHYGD